ncbi:MAG: hypothetical protein ACI8T1_003780 [Verrucomicrobiales bacterium]|jgi:hypothetical protein
MLAQSLVRATNSSIQEGFELKGALLGNVRLRPQIMTHLLRTIEGPSMSDTRNQRFPQRGIMNLISKGHGPQKSGLEPKTEKALRSRPACALSPTGIRRLVGPLGVSGAK